MLWVVDKSRKVIYKYSPFTLYMVYPKHFTAHVAFTHSYSASIDSTFFFHISFIHCQHSRQGSTQGSNQRHNDNVWLVDDPLSPEPQEVAYYCHYSNHSLIANMFMQFLVERSFTWVFELLVIFSLWLRQLKVLQIKKNKQIYITQATASKWGQKQIEKHDKTTELTCKFPGNTEKNSL